MPASGSSVGSAAGAFVNLALGLGAFAYSLLPPHRVKHYRRSVALLLRWSGLLLAGLSAAVLLLRTIGR